MGKGGSGFEKGLNRTSLDQRHPDLVTDFKTRAGLTPASPTTQAVQGQLDTARARIAELETENCALEQRVRTPQRRHRRDQPGSRRQVQRSPATQELRD